MMTKQYGLTLTELLISLLLSTVLAAGLLQLFVNCKHNYYYLNHRLAKQADLIAVTELIRNSIRQAGFTPCRSLNQLITKDTRTTNQQSILTAIKLTEGRHQALFLAHMDEEFDAVEKIKNARQLIIQAGHHYNDKRSVLIADCYHAEVHTIASVQALAAQLLITLAKPLKFTYANPVYIGLWQEEQYLVKKNQQGELALFYHNLHTEELSNNINAIASRTLTIGRGTIVQVQLETPLNNPLMFTTFARNV